MKGSVKRRGKSWRGRVDIGVDPKTGNRRFRSVTARTKAEVEQEIANIRAEIQAGSYIDPKAATFCDWLEVWFDGVKSKKRPKTVERYEGIINNHLKPKLGAIRLQQLQSIHIERYYRESKLTSSGLALHHTVIHSALESARKKRLVRTNEASLVDAVPRRRNKKDNPDVRANVWTREETLAFLEVAKADGPQQAAFYSVALELGLRKAEIAGLMWSDVDLESGVVMLRHQLTAIGSTPAFGPLKSGEPRRLDISSELAELLSKHRSHQAALKLRNRGAYHDHGLLFAKEWKNMTTGRAKLGDPLPINNLAQREFANLIKNANVRPIKFHGLRHTAATLALLEGVPLKVVSFRLGHANTAITADIYSHVIPEMQQDAARKLGSLLHR